MVLVDEGGEVTTVVEDQVGALAVLEGEELLLQAPEVLLVGLTLPGEDGDTGLGDGGSGVVLGGEDVAGSPGDLGTESGKGLDEDGGLDGHVEGTGDAGTLEDLGGAVLLAESHKTGHLVLGELDLLATEGSEGNVSYEFDKRWKRELVFFVIHLGIGEKLSGIWYLALGPNGF